jgi:hypothetical protein
MAKQPAGGALQRVLLLVAGLLLALHALQASAQTDPLPSWSDGAAKLAIVDFV